MHRPRLCAVPQAWEDPKTTLAVTQGEAARPCCSRTLGIRAACLHPLLCDRVSHVTFPSAGARAQLRSLVEGGRRAGGARRRSDHAQPSRGVLPHQRGGGSSRHGRGPGRCPDVASAGMALTGQKGGSRAPLCHGCRQSGRPGWGAGAPEGADGPLSCAQAPCGTPLRPDAAVCSGGLRRGWSPWWVFGPARHEVGSLPQSWLGFFSFKRSGSQHSVQ